METNLSLTTDGVEMVDYPLSTKQNVIAAAHEWTKFLELPDGIKEAFAAKQLQSGVGYERKGNGERESRDIKENFDVTKQSLDDLSSVASSDAVAQSFIDAARNLFDSAADMATSYGNHVESTYHIAGFANEAAASASSLFIRFLYYPPVPVGTVIGEPHVDHSGYTFHLYESTDGCERLSFDKQSWLPLPVGENKAAVFPSMQTQLFSRGELSGLCHKITANETTSRIGRIAIVCFIPLVNVPVYDRKTHGRLQEMAPGFNYQMNLDKFAQLFVNR